MTDAIPPTTASDAELVAEWRAAMEGVTPGEWFDVNPRARPGVIVGDLRIQNEAGRYVATVRRGAARTVPVEECDANAFWLSRCSPSGIASLLDRFDKLSAEVAAKDAETEAVSAAMGNSVRFMDPPDGGDPTQAEMVANMRRQLDAAEAEAAGLRVREGALIASLNCAKHQCETAVYNISQREHDEAVVRSFQSIADFCARASLSPRMEADKS